MNKTEKEINVEYCRGPLLESINAILFYQRTKEMLNKIDEQIKELSGIDTVHNVNQFQNSRQETKYLHSVYTLSVLKRRQERLKQNLVELQDRIQSDIETDKRYTNIQ